MPQENPGTVGQIPDPICRGYSPKNRIVFLGRERLVNGIGNQSQVNQSPNGKDVSRRDEIDRKTV